MPRETIAFVLCSIGLHLRHWQSTFCNHFERVLKKHMAFTPPKPSRMARLPSINDLAAFEAAARLKAYSKAADELCVTQSAISHRIHQLEARLGTRLFSRLKRSMVLTEAGESFLHEVRAIMNRLTAATSEVRTQPTRALRLTVTPSLAYTVLIPALPDFLARHNDIALEIDTSSRLSRLEDEGFDLALRFGSGNWPDYVVEHIVSTDVGAFASPSYLARFSKHSEQERLSAATLIHHRALSWKDWFQAQGLRHNIAPVPSLYFSETRAAVESAINGLGVVLVNTGMSSKFERQNALTRFVETNVDMQRSYYGVYSPQSAHRSTIKIFLSWLKPLTIKAFT
jgi:LysR family transcriptional regulator, glycine cleavage system transcriptional activator